MNDKLLGMNPDGTCAALDNNYESIRQFIGNTIDLCGGWGPVSAFIDDDGMLSERELNVPGSLALGRAIYGPVVVCAPEADDEGNTLAPDDASFNMLRDWSAIWQYVVNSAAEMGQDLTVRANPDTIPPPRFISLTPETFDEYLRTGKVPEE